jgi:ferredoxin
MEAPEFFDIDDEGLVVILQEKFDEDKRAHVESAARSCPVSALRVEDE